MVVFAGHFLQVQGVPGGQVHADEAHQGHTEPRLQPRQGRLPWTGNRRGGWGRAVLSCEN